MQFFINFYADGYANGLAFDWITGNIYAGTQDGNILACDGALDRDLRCVTLLTGQGYVNGIALDAVEGSVFTFLRPFSLLAL